MRAAPAAKPPRTMRTIEITSRGNDRKRLLISIARVVRQGALRAPAPLATNCSINL
jgi:hypothetical protein